MWESSDGRGTVPPWCDPRTEQKACFSVGDRIANVADAGGDQSVGTVVKVSTVISPLISVVWDDGDGGEIIYPMNAPYLRRAMPWE